MLGNMGCHYADLPFWAMELEYPTTIESEGPRPPHPESAPAWQHVHYTFDRGPGQSPFTLTWTHGPEPRGDLADYPLPEWAWGVFVGSEGQLLVSYPRYELRPERKFADYRRPNRSIPPPSATIRSGSTPAAARARRRAISAPQCASSRPSC